MSITYEDFMIAINTLHARDNELGVHEEWLDVKILESVCLRWHV